MEINILEQALLFAASYIANTMSAFAGGGSGLVQLPAILLLGLPFPIALATHKFTTVFLGLGAVARYLRHKESLLDLKFALFITIIGTLGTILGAFIIIEVPEHIAKTLLGLITISLGIYTAFKKDLGQQYLPARLHIKGYLITALVIFFIGIFNGSLTSGSGLFVTLWLILWHGFDYKRAVAYTMTLVGVFWNAAGAVTLTALGEPVHWLWLPALLLGAFLGGYTGAHLNILKGNVWIKRVFVAITLASGTSLFL